MFEALQDGDECDHVQWHGWNIRFWVFVLGTRTITSVDSYFNWQSYLTLQLIRDDNKKMNKSSDDSLPKIKTKE